MNETEKSFKDGFRYYCDHIEGVYAAKANAHVTDGQFEYLFQQHDHIGQIIAQIDKVTETYRNNTPGSRQGFQFEAFHRKTYDHSRIVNRQAHLPEAEQPAMGGYALPDAVADGVRYSAKVYADPHQTFREGIAVTHRDSYRKLKRPISEEQFMAERGITGNLDELKYQGQKHLTVSDYVDDIRKDAKSGARASSNRGTIREKNYREIERNTVDHIEDRYGNKSISITKAELEDLDKQALNKQLSPETLKAFGIDPVSTINWDQLKVQMAEQCLKTGATAAVIAAVLNAVPVIVNALSTMDEKGEFDRDAFCTLGYQALSAPAKGFLIGCSTSAIINALNFGRLKDAAHGAADAVPLSAAQCSMIAIGVSVLIGTIEIAVKRAAGKINRAEMADQIFECCLTSTLCIVGGMVSQKIITSLVSASAQQAVNAVFAPIISKVFGAAAAAAFPMFNVFSYLVGSLIGFAVAELIRAGTERLIFSFCVESGCTFFGLVDQNYELPQEVIDAIGVKVFDYEKFEYDSFQPEVFQIETFTPDRFEYDQFGVKLLRRGVIELGRIGYV